MLHLPGFYYVKKPKRFVILCSDKSSELNLSCVFDMRKPRKMEHLQKEEPFSSDPYFSKYIPLFPERGHLSATKQLLVSFSVLRRTDNF